MRHQNARRVTPWPEPDEWHSVSMLSLQNEQQKALQRFLNREIDWPLGEYFVIPAPLHNSLQSSSESKREEPTHCVIQLVSQNTTRTAILFPINVAFMP